MTKGERRQQKRDNKRNAMRMAGGSMRSTYPAVVLKRISKRKENK